MCFLPTRVEFRHLEKSGIKMQVALVVCATETRQKRSKEYGMVWYHTILLLHAAIAFIHTIE